MDKFELDQDGAPITADMEKIHRRLNDGPPFIIVSKHLPGREISVGEDFQCLYKHALDFDIKEKFLKQAGHPLIVSIAYEAVLELLHSQELYFKTQQD